MSNRDRKFKREDNKLKIGADDIISVELIQGRATPFDRSKRLVGPCKIEEISTDVDDSSISYISRKNSDPALFGAAAVLASENRKLKEQLNERAKTEGKSMTRDEKSLILFFGFCLVDNYGNVRTAHMNKEDMEIAKRWDAEKLIEFRRRPSKSIKNKGKIKTSTHTVRFTDKAWAFEAELRKERAARLVAKYGHKFG